MMTRVNTKRKSEKLLFHICAFNEVDGCMNKPALGIDVCADCYEAFRRKEKSFQQVDRLASQRQSKYSQEQKEKLRK